MTVWATREGLVYKSAVDRLVDLSHAGTRGASQGVSQCFHTVGSCLEASLRTPPRANSTGKHGLKQRTPAPTFLPAPNISEQGLGLKQTSEQRGGGGACGSFGRDGGNSTAFQPMLAGQLLSGTHTHTIKQIHSQTRTLTYPHTLNTDSHAETHTLTHTTRHTQTHTHSVPLTDTPADTHTHSHILTQIHIHSYICKHIHSHTDTHKHTLTHTHTLAHSSHIAHLKRPSV